MKKKFRLLGIATLSLASFALNAQINVSESFESGLPIGWITAGATQGFQNYSGACHGSKMMRTDLHPGNNHAEIVTQNYISDGNPIALSVQFTRTHSGIGFGLYYEINNSNYWLFLDSNDDTESGCKTLYGHIPASAVPAGTQVRFIMQANSFDSYTKGASFDDFRVVQQPIAPQVWEYDFDNSYNNINGNTPFSSSGTSFVSDRYENVAKAIRIGATEISANIADLPMGGNPRTVSLWFKNIGSVSLAPEIFSYGKPENKRMFGVYINTGGLLVFKGHGTGNDETLNIAAGNDYWHHLVVTYENNTVKVYYDGILHKTFTRDLNTGVTLPFSLGKNFSGAIDDLKIYNYVLTQSEIDCLHSGTIPIFAQAPAICTGVTSTPLPTISSNGITGTWSPALNNTATTTYTFTPNAGQCASRTTMTITFNPLGSTPIFTQTAPVCLGQSFTLPTTSNNGITGTWSPALNNTATTTYTFTPNSGQCNEATATMTVNVIPSNATPTFTQVTPICQGTSFTLPTSSNEGIIGTWTPAVNTNTTTTYTFTPNSGQCGAYMTTMTVVVNPSGVTPTFTQAKPVCPGTEITPLPTISNNGISGTWSPALNNTTTTTYTFTTSSGQCVAGGNPTMTITVHPTNVTPTFALQNALCIDVASPLPTVSENGIFGTWSPAWNSTAGTRTYTFTPNAGQCGTTKTETVVVENNGISPDLPINNTSPANLTICPGNTTTLSTASQTGAYTQWFTDNVTNTVIGTALTYTTPVLHNTTTYYVRRYYPASGCYTPRIPITVNVNNTNTVPTFTQVLPACQGQSFTLPTTSTNGITGTWSPAINNNVTTTYTFTPTAGQCGGITATATMTVTINPVVVAVTPTFTQVVPVCQGSSFTLPTTSDNGVTGTWSPAINSNATTTYTFTPNTWECGATTTTMTVTVNPSGTTPTFAIQNSLCSGAPNPLPNMSENGISGTWSPTWNPNASGIYTFTADSGCINPVTTNVSINTAGTSPTLPVNTTPIANLTICAGTSTTLSVSASGTVQWFLDNATQFVTYTGTSFTTPVLNSTRTYYVRQYQGSCYTPRIAITVTVIPAGATPAFTQVTPICQGATMTALPTTSNNGISGTWSPNLNNNATTTYTFTPSAGQCTSGNATMTINVNPATQTNLDTLVCNGTTLTFGSHAISANGTYSDTLQTTAGCDSIVHLQVTYRTPIVTTLNLQRCIGSSYLFDGQTLTADGTYNAIFTSTTGCDSIVMLNLTFISQITETVNATVCNENSYTFGTQQLTTTGIYTETFPSVGGCDSIVTLDLTVLPVITGIDIRTACGPFIWIDGNTYNNSSNTATFVVQSASGCDSTVTLNLTVTTIDATVSVSENTLTANQTGASYQWINCANNTPVSGATGQIFTPAISGTYSAEITLNGCTETSACNNVNVVGIDEISLSTISIYPNPATDFVIIENIPVNSTLTVLDFMGKMIYQTTVQGTTAQISTDAFASGMYHIQIHNASFEGIIKKLIVSR